MQSIVERVNLKGERKGLNLAESSCVMPISVGQPYHEGEKLEASLCKLNTTLKTVTILTACSLQRFTKAIEKESTDPEAFRTEAVKDGDAWIKRNEKSIQNILGKKCLGIIRWNDLLEKKEYKENREKIEKLYRTNATFHDATEHSVMLYFKRHSKSTKFDPNCNFSNLSRFYILEECAVVTMLTNLSFNFLVYPNKLNQAVYSLLELVVHVDHPRLLIPLRVTIKDNIQSVGEEKSLQQSIIQKGMGFSQGNAQIQISKQQLRKVINEAINTLPANAVPKFIACMSIFVEAVHVTEGEISTGRSPVCCSPDLSHSSNSFSNASSSSSSSSSSSNFPAGHFVPPTTLSLEQPTLQRSQSQPSFS